MKILSKQGLNLIFDKELIEGNILQKVLQDKNLGQPALCVVICSADLSASNPFVSLHYRVKRDQLTKRFCKTDKTYEKYFTKKQREVLEKAIQYYDETFNTQVDRDVFTYNVKMDQLSEMLKDLTPELVKNVHEITERITFTTNINIINKVLQDIVNIINAKHDVTKNYDNESKINVFRGKRKNQKQSPLEKGLLNINKK